MKNTHRHHRVHPDYNEADELGFDARLSQRRKEAEADRLLALIDALPIDPPIVLEIKPNKLNAPYSYEP